jgi:NADH-quinone oxidoreductase subunit M
MLSALIAIPAVGALVVALLPKGRDALAKRVALAVTVVVAVLSIVMAVQFDPNGPRFQFTEKIWWIKQFGVHYAVGADGVALVLIVLSTILVPLVVLASWNDAERSGGVDVPPKRSVKTTSRCCSSSKR